MFNSLQVIQDLERQREEIIKIQRQLCEPLLADTKYVGKIYDTIKNMEGVERTTLRRIVLMLVLLFFSPKKLIVDSKTNKRTMLALTDVTGLSQPLLSIYSRDLVFTYQHYNDFRDAVDMALASVKDMLVREGIDKDVLEMYLYRFK